VTTHILRNATVLTLDGEDRVLTDGAVALSSETGEILLVGPTADVDAAFPGATARDQRGTIVMPGMVNTHTHLFQTLLKGLGADRPLNEWFTSMTAPCATELTWDDCYIAALHGCMEALATGTTTLVEFMYVHPQHHLADAVIAAMNDAGIRGVLARGYMTSGAGIGIPEGLIEKLDTALDDAGRLIAEHNRPGSLVTVGLAPCTSWSVDEATLRETRRLADSTGALVTMHVAESRFDNSEAERRYGLRDTALLERHGVLGPDLLAVHCVQCDDGDIRRLADSHTAVSHNPCSNLYLGSGVARVPEMLAAGIRVGLASDGPASSNNLSMLQALKFAALVPKGVREDAEAMTAGEVIRMATTGGAAALGMTDRIGSLEAGRAADIVVVDPGSFSMSPVHGPAVSLVYSHRGDEVRDVWVAGRLVLSGGAPTGVDPAETLARSARAARALAARAGLAAR
jgi:5-methylthioadenosine/S-adenosylhomocysteine deaminase